MIILFSLSAHCPEKKAYAKYFQSKALIFFTNAVLAGNILTGIVLSLKYMSTLSLVLTDDNQYVKSWTTDRKSLKLKFIRPSSKEYNAADCMNSTSSGPGDVKEIR